MGHKSKSRKKAKARKAARSGLAPSSGAHAERGPVIPVTTIPRPDRNIGMEFTLVPVLSGPPEKAPPPLPPLGEAGPYTINFVLCVPGRDNLNEDLDLPGLMRSGRSLLQMPPGVANIEMTIAATVPIQFFSDRDGGLMSRATIRVNASNFEEAQRFAYNTLMPILSYWSYLHDVAIDVAAYEVTEERTGVLKYTVGMVGAVKAFRGAERYVSTDEHRRLFAAYREAMNTINIFYRVLSFYKVTEGVRILRTRRYRAAGNKGIPPGDPYERFPSDIVDLTVNVLSQKSFLPYLGQEFDSVLTSYETLIRNAVAHLDPHSDDVLDADRFDDLTACLRAERVLAYIARKMLDSEMGSLRANLPDVP
jgi:hypothetical protein